MIDYTTALRANLERMGFDIDELAKTSKFFSQKACFQYKILFKKDDPKGKLPEDIGFTFQVVYPDDADFYIDRIIVDSIGQHNGYSPYCRIYVRTRVPFPTLEEMIAQFIQRKASLMKSKKSGTDGK
jgi:hypothetical protein